MPRIEHIRETMHGAINLDYFEQKTRAGWKLTAVEWEREAEASASDSGELVEEVPYGLQVAGDCLHLKENQQEMQVMMQILKLIIEEIPLSQVAAELNRQGFRTRQGADWGSVAVFNMLPRLIEVGPRVFLSDQWVALRRQWAPGLVPHS